MRCWQTDSTTAAKIGAIVVVLHFVKDEMLDIDTFCEFTTEAGSSPTFRKR